MVIPGHDAKGRFTKGCNGGSVSGGKPKGLAAMVRARCAEGESLVAFYWEVFTDNLFENTGARIRCKLPYRMQAGEWLTDRGWGKPEQLTTLSGVAGNPIQVEYVNDWRTLRE